MDDGRFGTGVREGEYGALSPAALEATRVIERCMKVHHVVSVDYVDEYAHASSFDVRPAFIRHNQFGHVVLWCMPVDLDEWRELRLDRLQGARDAEVQFDPRW